MADPDPSRGPEVRVHRASYTVRGPEWAFALPQGDLAALEEVMAICSEFWNGVGSLIVPVRADGRIYPRLDELLAVRGVERVYLHERLGERAVQTLSARMPDVAPIYADFLRGEIHPFYLSLNDRPEVLSTLWRPLLRTPRLRRVALAAWGQIPEEDLPDWRARFNLGDVRDREALRHLLTSQIRGNTPLLLGARHMNTYEQYGGRDTWPHLFVFGRASFDELVYFWNLRSRLSSWAGLRPIVAVPRELLSPEELQPIRTWVTTPPTGTHYKPDISLAGPEREILAAAKALQGLGFKRADDDAGLQHSFPDPPKGREGLEYSEYPPGISGAMKRGATDFAQVTISDRRALLELPSPAGVRLPFGYLRLAIRGLPLPLPLNSVTANNIIQNAFVSEDGLTVLTTTAAPRWTWEVRLPNPTEALEQWAGAHGFTVSPSQPGRYAEALLGRLPGPGSLDALADPTALAILDQLAPRSTKKLAQRIVAELGRGAASETGPVDEARLADLLRDQGLSLAIEPRTLHEIASRTGKRKPHYLAAITALVESGLVRRGVGFRCPQCNFRQLFALGELDERIACRACRLELPNPVRDGSEEYPTSYFLDGLAAQLMEQDLLSVILALRRLRLGAPERPLFAWPGLIFKGPAGDVDADLLVSDGEQVRVFECKSRAEGLDLTQTQGLLALCETLGARPGIATLGGSFRKDVAGAVEAASGEIFRRPELLAAR
jgi:hypothetical protein